MLECCQTLLKKMMLENFYKLEFNELFDLNFLKLLHILKNKI